MALRNIVQIAEDKCNGCGLCISSCAEGAIKLIAGKARLVKDQYCDGLGACLGECPEGAISIIQREAEAFSEEAVEEFLRGHEKEAPVVKEAKGVPAGGCPGSMMRQFQQTANTNSGQVASAVPSALQQWPVQLHLLSPTAPYIRNADLLLAADCAAFSYGNFHAEFIADHALAIACPKLDNAQGYVEKLAGMIRDGGLHSITIVMMEVPCCRGLESFISKAMELAGKGIPVYRVIIGIEGDILTDNRPVSCEIAVT